MQSAILSQDSAGRRFPAAPSESVLRASHGMGWRGLTLERHRLIPGEISAHYVEGYRFSLHRGRAVPYEWRDRGRWKRTVAYPDDLMFVPHNHESVPCWNRVYEFTTVAIDPAFFSAALDDPEPEQIRLRERREGTDAEIVRLADLLEREVTAGGDGGTLYAESLGLALVRRLAAVYGERSLIKSLPHGRLTPGQIRTSLEFIQDHLGTDFSLADVADTLAVSPSHFAHLFKATFGFAPHQYALRQRVERARRLLRRGDRTTAQAALEAGFADQSHLTHAFKKILGVTPAAYARQSIPRQVMLRALPPA